MPSEPAESNFKNKVRARAYPCVERCGVVWTYMGPRETPPPLPDLEANMLETGWAVNNLQRACNWMQALEGDIDTVHVPLPARRPPHDARTRSRARPATTAPVSPPRATSCSTRTTA